MRTFAFVLALLVASAARAESLAVLELRSRLPEAERGAIDATYLTDRIRAAALQAAPEMRVLTRENVVVLLKSLGRSLEDCEGECEVETGRKLGAELVLSGELLRYGRGIKASLRLHDTRDGRLLGASVATGSTAEELEAALPAAVRELLAAHPPEAPSGAAEGVRFAGELRLSLPLTPDVTESNAGFYFGIAAAGLRLGAHRPAEAGSVGWRFGAGFDAGLYQRRLTQPVSNITDTSSIPTLMPSLYAGLLVGGGRWTFGLSYVPTLVLRPVYFGAGFVDQRSLRFLCFEGHAERALSEGPGRKLYLKLFANALAPIGISNAGSRDDTVLYTHLGVALAWQ